HHRDRHSLRNTGMFIDVTVFTCFERDLLDHFTNELRNDQSILNVEAIRPRLLARDLHREGQLFRIVRRDLGADAILQRRNDLSARGVVFRIGREHQHHVERQPHGITLNLHVAFLHDVEKTNLDFPRQIRELVDRKDSAVRTRQETVVNRQLIAQQVAALRGLDRIDVADDVGDGHVWCGEFLDEPRIAIDPRDGRVVSLLLQHLAPVRRDWSKRIVVDFRTGNDRDLFVEQIREQANNPAFCLPAKAKQDDVVPRQNRVYELRNYAVVITDNAGEKLLARAKFLN